MHLYFSRHSSYCVVGLTLMTSECLVLDQTMKALRLVILTPTISLNDNYHNKTRVDLCIYLHQ